MRDELEKLKRELLNIKRSKAAESVELIIKTSDEQKELFNPQPASFDQSFPNIFEIMLKESRLAEAMIKEVTQILLSLKERPNSLSDDDLANLRNKSHQLFDGIERVKRGLKANYLA